MRFFTALAISFVLHIAIGSTFFLFHKTKQLPTKDKIISLRLKKFDIEKKSTLAPSSLEKKKKTKINPPQKKEKPKVIKKKKIVQKIKKTVKKRVAKKQIKKKELKKVKSDISQKKLKTKQIAQTIEEKNEVKTLIKQKSTKKSIVLNKSLSEDEVQSYLSKIYSIIDRYKTYPPRAKSFGIQGEVLVQFTLYKNGKISDIKILKSSGARFLDVHTVDKVLEASSAFPKPPKELEMRVPIRYFFK
jgi:periplasmic protein TonB